MARSGGVVVEETPPPDRATVICGRREGSPTGTVEWGSRASLVLVSIELYNQGVFIRVDPTDRSPIFAQIAASVRGAIVRGDIGAGERLPAARELAASLDVNVHTVLRGYQILRDEGLVELRRGRGAVVSDRAPEQAEIGEALDRLIGVAQRWGLGPTELSAEITRRMS